MGKHLNRLVRLANFVERKLAMYKVANWDDSYQGNDAGEKDGSVHGDAANRALFKLQSDTTAWINSSLTGPLKDKKETKDFLLTCKKEGPWKENELDIMLAFFNMLKRDYVKTLPQDKQQEAIRDLDKDIADAKNYWYVIFPNFDKDRASGAKPKGSKYPTIDPDIQKRLSAVLGWLQDNNKLQLPKPELRNLKQDGVRGPLTNKALEIYAQYKNISIDLKDTNLDLNNIKSALDADENEMNQPQAPAAPATARESDMPDTRR